MLEFKLEETELTLGMGLSFTGGSRGSGSVDVFFKGPAGVTVEALAERAIRG